MNLFRSSLQLRDLTVMLKVVRTLNTKIFSWGSVKKSWGYVNDVQSTDDLKQFKIYFPKSSYISRFLHIPLARRRTLRHRHQKVKLKKARLMGRTQRKAAIRKPKKITKRRTMLTVAQQVKKVRTLTHPGWWVIL